MSAPSSTCPCGSAATRGKSVALNVVPSASLSVLIAFFPKCPVCWAVYMSMFGSLGLSRLPYMGWLLPVLVALMALHLLLLWRKAPRIGWRPLILSVAGCVTIAATRLLDVTTTWPVLFAMAFIVSGSWLSSRVECQSTR